MPAVAAAGSGPSRPRGARPLGGALVAPVVQDAGQLLAQEGVEAAGLLQAVAGRRVRPTALMPSSRSCSQRARIASRLAIASYQLSVEVR
jgi:hypothetical protein